MYKLNKTILSILIILLIALAHGCKWFSKPNSTIKNHISENHTKNKPMKTVNVSNESDLNKPSNITNSNKTVEYYAINFYKAINESNLDILKSISDQNGVKVVRVFLSGNGVRGTDWNETIGLSKISNDLTFPFDGDVISLNTEYQTNKFNFSKTKQISSEECFSNQMIRPELVDVCSSLMADNDYSNQNVLFSLKNGGFCLAYFAQSDIQFSRWAVFKKNQNQYLLQYLIIIN